MSAPQNELKTTPLSRTLTALARPLTEAAA